MTTAPPTDRLLPFTILCHRNPNMTEDDFHTHWTTRHGPLVREWLARHGVLKYTQVPPPVPFPSPLPSPLPSLSPVPIQHQHPSAESPAQPTAFCTPLRESPPQYQTHPRPQSATSPAACRGT